MSSKKKIQEGDPPKKKYKSDSSQSVTTPKDADHDQKNLRDDEPAVSPPAMTSSCKYKTVEIVKPRRETKGTLLQYFKPHRKRKEFNTVESANTSQSRGGDMKSCDVLSNAPQTVSLIKNLRSISIEVEDLDEQQIIESVTCVHGRTMPNVFEDNTANVEVNNMVMCDDLSYPSCTVASNTIANDQFVNCKKNNLDDQPDIDSVNIDSEHSANHVVEAEAETLNTHISTMGDLTSILSQAVGCELSGETFLQEKFCDLLNETDHIEQVIEEHCKISSDFDSESSSFNVMAPLIKDLLSVHLETDMGTQIINFGQINNGQNDMLHQQNSESSCVLDHREGTSENVSLDTAEIPDDYDSDVSDPEETVVTSLPKFKLVPLLLILKTKLKHNLTYTSVEDVAELLKVYCEDTDFSMCNKYFMKNVVQAYSESLKLHQLCPGCGVYVGELSCDVCCRKCRSFIRPSKNLGLSFLFLSLEKQIKILLENKIITEEDLSYPTIRRKEVNSALEDIFDGSCHKDISENGKYKTINFFLDGLTVTDATKLSAWPVLSTINELPPFKRKKHILLSSLWLGKDKPDCNEYLKPFVDECMKLATVGVKYVLNGVQKTIKFRANQCIADSVARPAIQNSTLFSGNFGCSFCLHPGEYTATGRGGMISYSPLHDQQWGEPEAIWYPRRTHEATINDAQMAIDLGLPQNGIKGKSILAEMEWFDIVDCLDVDVMHVIMNVGKTFAKLWFKEKYGGEPYSIHHMLGRVNERLQNFQPTSEVSRSPRSLKYYSDFKAHEWACWILLYSLPALKGILPARFLDHWALLVCGLSRLTDKSIRLSEVELSRRDLEEFCIGTHELYGQNCVTFNVHLLTHLSQSVLNFGNLWTHSAFQYETYNSSLKNSVKSSNGIMDQIVMNFKTGAAVQFMEADLNEYLSVKEKSYLQKLSEPSVLHPSKIVGVNYLYGKASVRRCSEAENFALHQEGIGDARNLEFFLRCKPRGHPTLQATDYRRTTKKNNSVVLLKDNTAATIKTFAVVEERVYCLGHILVPSHDQLVNGVKIPHMWCVNPPEGRLRCFPIESIVQKLIFMEMPVNLQVVCRHPYEMEDLS